MDDPQKLPLIGSGWSKTNISIETLSAELSLTARKCGFKFILFNLFQKKTKI